MMKVNLPCDCGDEEHEVEVEAEWTYRGTGLYCPDEGDQLPCGRLITEKDLRYIIDYLDGLNIDEG